MNGMYGRIFFCPLSQFFSLEISEDPTFPPLETSLALAGSRSECYAFAAKNGLMFHEVALPPAHWARALDARLDELESNGFPDV